MCESVGIYVIILIAFALVFSIIAIEILSIVVIADVSNKSTWVPVECNFCGNANIEKSGAYYKGIMNCEYNYLNETKIVNLQYPGSAPAWAVGKNMDAVEAWINKNAYFQNTTCYVKEFGVGGTDAYDVTYDPTIWFVVFIIIGGFGAAAGHGIANKNN